MVNFDSWVEMTYFNLMEGFFFCGGKYVWTGFNIILFIVRDVSIFQKIYIRHGA